MLYKICPRCNKIINYTQRYCDKCTEEYKDNKKLKNKIYDSKYRKNKEVYHSTNWDKVKVVVKNRDNNLCRICLDQERIRPVKIVHHIIPVEDNEKLVYNPTNLISVCDSCHRDIHSTYDKTEHSKKELQKYLNNLIKSDIEL